VSLVEFKRNLSDFKKSPMSARRRRPICWRWATQTLLR